jgi:uncharacterized glyoxalase superfamily protein PhnB
MTDDAAKTEPKIYPTFRYEDAPAAIEWLERAFGFERHMVVAGSEGAIDHAELKLGGTAMIMLGGTGRADPANPWTTAPSGTYVAVADVDAHYARAKAAGARIFRDLNDTDYGSREYSAYDCEGKLWSFGTYRP